jgi:hypothetical protein
MVKNLKINMFFMLSLVLLMVSCNDSSKEKTVELASVEDPVELAISFYDLVNKGDFAAAKLISSPSTTEILDEISAYKMVSEEKKFKLLEVKKKDQYKEGDTVVVNYKVGDLVNNLKLCYLDKKFKVIPTESIKIIRKFVVNSIDLYNGKIGGKKFTESNFEKIEGYRVVLKNLLIKNTFVGIGNTFVYDPINNYTPIDKVYKYYNGSWGPTFTDNRAIVVNGKNVELNDCCSDEHYGSVDEYTNLSIRFISDEEAQKIEPSTNERVDSEENPLVDSFTKIYNVEGFFVSKNTLNECFIVK